METQTLHVDRIRCDGHGLCAELLPELIRLDDWGYPIVRTGPVPAHLAGMLVAPSPPARCSRSGFAREPTEPMDAESRRPSDRDAALARLRTWRVAIAVAGAVGVAAVGTVAAETIPGRADSGSTGAAQSPDPGSSDQQQPQVDGGGFQQPFGAPRSGFGRGQAVTGGS